MFETNDQARLQPSIYFVPEEGTHRWAYISQTSNHEWFYVTYETTDDEEVVSLQQLMVPIAPYLLGLATRDAPDAFIRSIQLVSPPWMNGSGSWLMEDLKEIRSVGPKYLYELSDGKIYPKEFVNASAKTLWSKTEH
ncbi:hypothetical protein [Pseudomonas taiwanensis]|uniref:Uncharacterized protein n=1 Tax=Pseudomonas taiwanensis TaxID=470150 RepID=A0ABR6V576_9PSED|nr:hypothetical protein [Pseudomonas taiwanensis]MBC3475621.1 hypothetical protein [Pseudomonas taiwanensis]